MAAAALVSPEVAADLGDLPPESAGGEDGDRLGRLRQRRELQKGADGIWTATIGPLDPEMYVYFFTVDGVRLTDPSNPQVKIGYVTSTTTSLVTVPGDGAGVLRRAGRA